MAARLISPPRGSPAPMTKPYPTRPPRRPCCACAEALEPRRLLPVSLTRDINTTPVDHSAFGQFTPLGDQLLFVHDDGVHGPELFRSDGTAGGTTLVRDILPGPQGSSISGLTVV